MSNEISEHVALTITQDSVGIQRAGFGMPMILSCNATWPERLRLYASESDVLDDFVSTSPEYLAAAAICAQDPRPPVFAIGRAAGKPTLAYKLTIPLVAAGSVYSVDVLSQTSTVATVSYTPGADLTVSAVTNGADSLTVVAHGMSTGDGPYRVSNSGGGLPTGLAVDTNYWIIKLTADTFSLATSKANALATTAINITSDGTGTQTIRRAQNDVICAQLVQGINAIASKNFTAAQTVGAGETDFVTVTGDAAGNWFSVAVSDLNLLSSLMTHAEPGTTLATDLAAISDENDAWYLLITLYNSQAYATAAAAVVEGLKKIYIASTSDSICATAAHVASSSTDLMEAMMTLARKRTAVLYSPIPSQFAGAAWAGSRLPLDPGSETWKFAVLSGVSPTKLSTTQRGNIRAKNGNGYTLVSPAGGNTWEGKTADGRFIDTRRGLDWIDDDMSKGVYEAISGARTGGKKLGFDDPGVAVVQNEIDRTLSTATRMRILSPDEPYTITVPRAKDVSPSKKTSRILPDLKWHATGDGALHGVEIDGTVSV